MIRPSEIRRDLTDVPEAEREQLVSLGGRLLGSRPAPRASFRAELRQRLLGDRKAERTLRPRRLRLLIASYCGSGLLALLVAALGLTGIGPFAS